MLTTSPCEEKKEKKIMTYEKKKTHPVVHEPNLKKKTSRSGDTKLDGTEQRSIRLQKLRAEHDKK